MALKSKNAQMEPFPTKPEDLKRIVQDLWDSLDRCWMIKHIENMPEKCEEVLRQHGLATKH